MGFERFGTVSFTSETKSAAFVDSLDKGKVMATRCKKCHRVYFPPRADCADDNTSDMEWMDVTGNGKLLTYTTVAYGPTGFENDTPYTLAIAEFAGGVHIFGRLDKQLKEVKVGMPLKLVPVVLPDKKVIYQFQKP